MVSEGNLRDESLGSRGGETGSPGVGRWGRGGREEGGQGSEYVKVVDEATAKWILQGHWATFLATFTNFWSESSVCLFPLLLPSLSCLIKEAI
jgi:hypothetical protein